MKERYFQWNNEYVTTNKFLIYWNTSTCLRERDQRICEGSCRRNSGKKWVVYV